MAAYNSILDNYVKRYYFAGDEEPTQNQAGRDSLIRALDVRKKECLRRCHAATGLLIAAIVLLIVLCFFQRDGIKTFKEIMSLVGGGSIAALLFYIINVRDEITKINQTLILASAVEKTVLDTMLLTLIGK